MPSKAIGASPAVAHFLKETRESLGLTLRGVASLSSTTGNPIPHSTLARIERGKLDPGVLRLQQLLRLYNLPTQAAGDLLDLEALAGPVPFERDPVKLRDLAVTAWREGRVGDALAHFFAFRDRVNKTTSTAAFRQEATLSFAVAASGLGKHHLAKRLLEDLLVAGPDPGVIVATLVQLSNTWRGLGSAEAAIAFLERAATHVAPEAHRHRGWIEHQRALLRLDAGAYDEVGPHLGAALRFYRRAGSPRDEASIYVALANLAFHRKDAPAAIAAARRAVRFADGHKFARLKMFALLEEARAHQLAAEIEESRRILRAILADSLVTDDSFIRFYAHYYLWEAERAGGDTARAEIELREAAYFVRFVDEAGPEATEVRKHLTTSERKPGRKP